jgi:hypothetical protein
MGPEHTRKPQAAVQTAGQAGSYVWAITVLVFTPCELGRSIVSDEKFATAAAAKDAGDACLKATVEEKQADHWFGRLAAVPEPEVFMQRTVEYRGFEIHVDLLSTSKDMFDVWFRIEGPIKPPGVAALGERIKIQGGPFSHRWAYFVAEIAGQAAIDVILGPAE